MSRQNKNTENITANYYEQLQDIHLRNHIVAHAHVLAVTDFWTE